MAQEKFEDRLNQVADTLQDILDDCNTELEGKGVEEANALNDVPTKIRSIEQGGGGASTWSEIENKPFETIGSGLSVDGQGVLSATGGGNVEFFRVTENTNPDDFYDALNANKVCYVCETDAEDPAILNQFVYFMGDATSESSWDFYSPSQQVINVELYWDPETGDGSFIFGEPRPISGAGGADWNASSGEAGFIENKPFDVETTADILSDLELFYSAEMSTQFNSVLYGDVAEPVQISTPLAGGMSLNIAYDNKTITENLVDMSGMIVSQTYVDFVNSGYTTLHNGCLLMPDGEDGMYIFTIVDNTLPATEGSSIIVDITQSSVSKLSADKIDINDTLKSNNGVLTVNADGHGKEFSNHLVINGGLNSAIGLGVNIGDGLYLSQTLRKIPSALFQNITYNAELSGQMEHTVYQSTLEEGCLCSLALADTQFRIEYMSSSAERILEDTFRLKGDHIYYSDNAIAIETPGGELPQTPFMAIIIEPNYCSITIVDDDLPAEENTLGIMEMLCSAYFATDVSLQYASAEAVGGIIIGEGLERDSTTQKTKVSASASTTLGGVKTYFDTNTNTLYLRTDNQDAQPSGD